MEYVSPEGLRVDGRRPRELRRLSCQLDVLQSADGSAIFEMGNTKVGLHAAMHTAMQLANNIYRNMRHGVGGGPCAWRGGSIMHGIPQCAREPVWD